MAIHYEIQAGCRPRTELGEEFLSELIRKQLRIRLIESDLAARGIGIDESLTRLQERVIRPDGVVAERTVSMEELREEVHPLAEYRDHCEGCPACLADEAYGCFGTIDFPISALAEEWLLSCVGPEGSQSRSLLLDAAENFRFGGETRFHEWRRLGLLERPQPMLLEGGGASSETLLHQMFLVGEVSPNHGLGVLLQTDALDTSDGRSGDEVVEMLLNLVESGDASEAPELRFARPPVEGEDRSILQLKRYLYALYIAFGLETMVRVQC